MVYQYLREILETPMPRLTPPWKRIPANEDLELPVAWLVDEFPELGQDELPLLFRTLFLDTMPSRSVINRLKVSKWLAVILGLPVILGILHFMIRGDVAKAFFTYGISSFAVLFGPALYYLLHGFLNEQRVGKLTPEWIFPAFGAHDELRTIAVTPRELIVVRLCQANWRWNFKPDHTVEFTVWMGMQLILTIFYYILALAERGSTDPIGSILLALAILGVTVAHVSWHLITLRANRGLFSPRMDDIRKEPYKRIAILIAQAIYLLPVLITTGIVALAYLTIVLHVAPALWIPPAILALYAAWIPPIRGYCQRYTRYLFRRQVEDVQAYFRYYLDPQD